MQWGLRSWRKRRSDEICGQESGVRSQKQENRGKKENLPLATCLFPFTSCPLPLAPAFAFDLHGFLQGNYSYRTSDTHCSGAAPCDKYWLLIEERVQISPSYEDSSGIFAAKAKLDFFHK